MSLVSDMAHQLAEAVRTVSGVRVYEDVGATVDPPGAVIGPPELTWTGPGLTDATFVIAVVVKPTARAIERLWELVPQVAAAADEVPDAVVRRATPGTWGADNLPCYLIEIEAAL